ncbi:MAG: hypothetical protein GY904_28325 [Planctomycetaceae bacterium]|nr:hypothetical protein [Planctomycetaceae bacterium]
MPDTPDSNQNPDQLSVTGWRKLARASLVVYVIALAAFAGWSQQNPDVQNSVLATNEDSIWIVETASRIGAATARDLAIFSILGFLCGAACAPSVRGASLVRVIASTVTGFAVAVIIATVANALMQGLPLAPPTILSAVIILLASIYGSWLGATWMNSKHVIAWTVAQVALAVVLILGGLTTLVRYSISSDPLQIIAEEVSTEDRRRLVALFRDNDPRELASDEIAEMIVTEQDLNQLANWGFSLLPGEQRTQVKLANDQVILEGTLKLPSLPLLGGYLNVVSAGSLRANSGELVYAPNQFTLGKINIPPALFRYTGPVVLDEEWQHGSAGPLFRSLQSIVVGDEAAVITYSNLDIDKDFVRDTLIEFGVLEDLEDSCSEQVKELVKLAEASRGLTLSQCMQTAFTTARQRSQGGDAVRENRAAILALGYLLGNERVGAFAGGLERPSAQARKIFKQIKIRGRRDWTQHFSVSAALQVLGNRSASFDVGILKEELDADGGSGFSFGDLLADRSGTEFASQVTESQEQAIAFQNKISNGFLEQDYFPPGTGLPEGITDREFQDDFGGVGGPEYSKLLAEIDARIASLAAYAN